MFIGAAAENELSARARAVSRLAAALTMNAVLSTDIASLHAGGDEMMNEPDIAGVTGKGDRGRVLVGTPRHGTPPPDVDLRRIERRLELDGTTIGSIELALTATLSEQFRHHAFQE